MTNHELWASDEELSVPAPIDQDALPEHLKGKEPTRVIYVFPCGCRTAETQFNVEYLWPCDEVYERHADTIDRSHPWWRPRPPEA